MTKRSRGLSKSVLPCLLILVCLASIGGAPSESLASAASTETMGETNVLSGTDSGNGNILLAQQAVLPHDGTLQSLSFYVVNATGKLRLGVYDSSGVGGGPGSLVAETAEITPAAGWNTAPATSQPTLKAGYYWLAYLPSSNGLSFRIEQTGAYRDYQVTYGSLPTTVTGGASSSSVGHWSFFATLQVSGAQDPGQQAPASTPTTQLAWFYNRPTDGTTPLTLVQRHQTMILSGSDYEVGFLQQVRSSGWTRPILEYVDEAFAMGPSSAMTGSCPSGYAGYSTTWTSGDNEFCQMVNPNESWFLHNGAGQRIYRDAGGGSYFYLMNPGVAGWRAYVQAKTASLPSDYHMDGVFLDDVWATANDPRNREDDSDGTCLECGTDAQWLQAQIGMLKAVKTGAGSQPVWINSDSTTDLVAPVDGFMVENMGASWGTGFMPQSEVEQRWTDIDAAIAAGKNAILVGQGSQGDTERMRFSHVVYLMVAGPNVSYRFQNAGDYRAFWDYPEFKLALGTPNGPRYRVGSSVWRRDFSAGTAVVNLSATTSQTVSLGASYALPGGGTATSVTLAPNHGLALALASGSQPPPPPAAPGAVPNERATSTTQTSVSIAWDAASGTVDGYQLSLNGAASGTTTALQWETTDLTCGTTYSFAVQAYNSSGNGPTSTISATTADCPPPPAAPGAVPNERATSTTQTSVSIAWDAASGTVDGYQLSLNGAASGTTTALQWETTDLTCGTTYSFAVQAYNSSGNGPTSTISATTADCPPPPAAPGAVPNERATSTTQTSVSIAWDAASGTVDGYQLSLNGAASGTTTALQWETTDLTCGTTYSFAVQAYNSSGNGPTSTISATTADCKSPGPVNTSLPTISGRARVGSMLRGSLGLWTDGVTGLAYQWLRCSASNGSCTTIQWATSQNYVPSSSTRGSVLRLRVTATDASGSASATSQPTRTVR